jgi:hypothetical protein
VPENLHARANREDNCALVDGAMEPLAAFKFAGGLNLRSVFATTDEVEVGRIGNWRSGIDSDVFDRDAAPFETARKYEYVSTVAVGAE